MKCYQVAAIQLCVWRPGSVGDAGHWDVVLAFDVTDGSAVPTLEHRLSELDPLSARTATLHNHNCLLLEGVLTGNDKIWLTPYSKFAQGGIILVGVQIQLLYTVEI